VTVIHRLPGKRDQHRTDRRKWDEMSTKSMSREGG
jgi:hypothetical protein